MKKLVIAFSFLTAFAAQAQQVKDFKLTNVLNGNSVSLGTYPSCSGVIVVFTSNSCPYDEYYRSRINKLSRDYQDKVPVLLVNSNIDAAESDDAMKKKAEQAGITLPYLSDKDQAFMTALGVTKSPAAYLLKNDGGKFTVVYKGAIDDNAQVEADVRHHHLKDAVDIMLANQSVQTPEVRPTGCTIRKK
jgi:peroxiredoxin